MTDLLQEAQSAETTAERLLEIAEEASDDVETLLEIFRNPNCENFEKVFEVLDDVICEENRGLQQDLASNWKLGDPTELLELLIDYNDGNEEDDAFVRLAIAENQATPARYLEIIADPDCMSFAREEYQDSAWNNLELELLCKIIQNPNINYKVIERTIECLESISCDEAIPNEDKATIVNESAQLIIDHPLFNDDLKEIIQTIEFISEETLNLIFKK